MSHASFCRRLGVVLHDISAKIELVIVSIVEREKANVSSYHWNAAQSRAPQEALASTQIVGNVEGEDDHAECLGDTVEPGREKLEVGASNAEGGKDAWRIVSNLR